MLVQNLMKTIRPTVRERIKGKFWTLFKTKAVFLISVQPWFSCRKKNEKKFQKKHFQKLNVFNWGLEGNNHSTSCKIFWFRVLKLIGIIRLCWKIPSVEIFCTEIYKNFFNQSILPSVKGLIETLTGERKPVVTESQELEYHHKSALLIGLRKTWTQSQRTGFENQWDCTT